ncbi:hypothetical protein [Cellulomonas massiliensis]|uniref:hypothetical protein n=1 Tax=Cellulomonas massiliensis TaxID=1465811 RepID=UPI000315E884|nr:hypothetical protein [Cellulomonas massiliensis]
METPQDYLDSLDEPARGWVTHLVRYAERRSGIGAELFRSRPMVKVGRTWQDGYVLVTAAKDHGTVHALDFDLVDETRRLLPRAGSGRGSVRARYDDEAAVAVLERLVDRVLERHGVALRAVPPPTGPDGGAVAGP